jgi:hypothetical protein
MMPRPWALLFACAALGLAVNAAEPRKIDMHRSGAGTFSADSWVRAESTGGRYSVLMPAPFDDYTQQSNQGDGNQAYYLRARLPDSTWFIASRVEYADAPESTKNCKRAREGQLFGGDMESRRAFEVDGRPAAEVTVKDGRAWLVMRVICLETEGMLLSVAAPLDKIPQAKVMAEKFFASLRFNKQ